MKLIMYASTAVIEPNVTGTPTGLSSIVSECRKNNPIYEITGALYYRHRKYLQIVEGESGRIDHLMSNILNDSRHKQCIIQIDVEVKKRVFPKWQCQLNMVVERDIYLRQFLVSYADQLREMNQQQKEAFSHFFKKKTPRDSNKPKAKLVNVFGNELIQLTGRDLPKSDFSPFVMQLCDSLALKPYSVDQLIDMYGESKRDQVPQVIYSLICPCEEFFSLYRA